MLAFHSFLKSVRTLVIPIVIKPLKSTVQIHLISSSSIVHSVNNSIQIAY